MTAGTRAVVEVTVAQEDPADGRVLWHSGLAAPVSNTPITYMLDGVQYVLVAGGDCLYAFSLQN